MFKRGEEGLFSKVGDQQKSIMRSKSGILAMHRQSFVYLSVPSITPNVAEERDHTAQYAPFIPRLLARARVSTFRVPFSSCLTDTAWHVSVFVMCYITHNIPTATGMLYFILKPVFESEVYHSSPQAKTEVMAVLTHSAHSRDISVELAGWCTTTKGI